MDVHIAVATVEPEGTLAPTTALDSPISTTIAPMEAASPTEAKRAATGGRDAKPKAAKKVFSKEEKGVEAAMHRCWRKNLEERTAAAATMEATQQA
jgi:hypothetical protein